MAYRQRQTVEIVLNAVAMTAPLNTELFLKGGILLGLAYGSPRQTTDIDLTAAFSVDDIADDRIRTLLDLAFPRAAANLGYPDLIVRIQSVRRLPAHIHMEAEFPALKLKIAYATRGTREERALHAGRTSSVVDVDISFNEPLKHVQILELTGGQALYAYGLIDLMAEKYRALLQQVPRNRYRRQDVYDLDVLIRDHLEEGVATIDILEAVREKCAARRIKPNRSSLDNIEVKTRAGRDWDAMQLELDVFPAFEDCYGRVADFFRSLPWEDE